MTALTPSLAIVAARLPSPPSSIELLDEDVAGDTPDWRGIAVPEHLMERFARRSDAAPLAGRPIAGGQIHLLARRPGFGAVLLDAWDSSRQRWRGWLVTPDASYADACGLVVEERDAPADPRAGLVLCDMPVTLAVTDLGACLGVFSQERLQAARWLEWHGRANAATAAPGVIARVALPGDDYALTGTPLSSELGKDGRVAYRQLLRQGLQQLQIAPADAAAPAAKVPMQAANANRWLKLVTAVAASVMVVQSAWLFLPKEGAVVGNAEFRNGGSGVETGVRTRVLFRAEATEAEIRTWLQREQLEIVAGPDTLGAFTVLSRNRQKVLPPPGPGNPLAVINP
ncbi:hypothetical protein P9875_02310 [Janthinobacterium rivuli]|uniref:GspL cytoplasmic actin-ATPase-like domain-containing protein n=1 Tax=Janthinobacterium rivuli TaxID=2751478 RepID=A0ABY8I814_9BURK|nr:hypothetical protein [Janthinobacterium rivuli]WFR80032.1 hypothetical protein P9875_02310 [Janthinobacterium rivuli]